MQYAARLTTLPSPKGLAVPLAALALGAAVATGAYALIDEESIVQEPAKVIVVDTPTPGEGVSAKNEAGVAAAVGAASLSDAAAVKDESASAAAVGSAAVSDSAAVKDESASAAAVGSAAVSDSAAVKDESASAAAVGSGSTDVELRGSKASSSSDDAATALRTDAHGLAATSP